MSLQKEVIELRNSDIKNTIDRRLKEFENLGKNDSAEWFSELCFCLLTANSKAETALKIQSELGPKEFCSSTHTDIRDCIIKHKHRFHNNKSRFIMDAREHKDIKEKIKELADRSQPNAREWLVKNIKGLGYKEASHFLRNVGYKDLAILDRHILNLFVENKIIKEKPASLNRNTYLEIEQKFLKLADKLKMSAAELDLYLWYMKTGKILK